MMDAVSRAILSLAAISLISKVRNNLSRIQLFSLSLGLAVVIRKYKTLFQLFTKKFGESTLDRFGAILLATKPVQKEYSKLLNDTLMPGRESIAEAWKEYGKLYTKIPDEGISVESLKKMVENLACITHQKLKDTHHSGSIYSFSYWNSDQLTLNENLQMRSYQQSLAKPQDFDRLAQNLSELYTFAFKHSYLWNSLHEGEFGTGYWLQYQVIRMVADLYGGKPDECMGFVTSGGTESLMTAVRMYREWGINNRNHNIGQGVILCSNSVHAAVTKGCQSFDVQLRLIPTDDYGGVDIEAMKSEVDEIGSDLVAIVGSTPQYSLGTIDPIRELADIARKAGVGMHVDSCLGGFIINFLENVNPNFMEIPGVTSLSCDTHKNGWAPKGSSVLVTKAIPDKLHPPKVNLSFYGSFSIPEWDGGIYGTPSFPGSAGCTHILHAYLAMLHIGKGGYETIANAVHSTVDALAEVIAKDERLELLGDHPANVVAFRINPAIGWNKGAIYAMVHEMKQRNIVMSAMAHERVHYCVTGRSAADSSFIGYFSKVVKEAADATEALDRDVKEGKRAFPGDAGLYGTIEAAIEPSASNTVSKAEYISNLLLGKRVARDSVKAHFFALQDPYVDTKL